MENHHFYWENPLFLWPCSIAFCMFTRGYIPKYAAMNGDKKKNHQLEFGVPDFQTNSVDVFSNSNDNANRTKP